MSQFPVRQKLQEALDELDAVCKKHGIVLTGADACDGTYKEILVHKIGRDTRWANPNRLKTDLYFNAADFYTDAIGTKE